MKFMDIGFLLRNILRTMVNYKRIYYVHFEGSPNTANIL